MEHLELGEIKGLEKRTPRPISSVRVSLALAQSLKIEGVDTLFALPGIQMDYLFDAI
jgi:hypothetical protein